MRRRHFLRGLCTLPLIPLFTFPAPVRAASSWEEERLSDQIKALSLDAGGKLGLSLYHNSRGKIYDLHGDDRFSLCSTFKLILVGSVLHRSFSEETLLQENIPVTKDDIISHSPILQRHAGQSVSVETLCAAALTESDNGAANLLLHQMGGPQALRSFAWSVLGDHMFRLDRWEPELNNVSPRDVRDSTTPNAMAASVHKLVLGTILRQEPRQKLENWLRACRTGAQRIRAGVPSGWQVGNRSGTGPYGVTNDVAVLWPQKGEPMVLAMYHMDTEPQAPLNEELLAHTARLICAYRW